MGPMPIDFGRRVYVDELAHDVFPGPTRLINAKPGLLLRFRGQLFYIAKDNDSCIKIAKTLRLDKRALHNANTDFYPGMRQSSKLR